MNIDSVYFKKKDIVNSREAFNELEKVKSKTNQKSINFRSIKYSS